jgi:CBS domain-containing protein
MTKDDVTPLRREPITVRAGWRRTWQIDASIPVGDCMERDLRYLRPLMWAERAVKYMWESGVSELPVLDDKGGPVGIVYLADLLAATDPASDERPRVKDIMATAVPTVGDDVPVARAAARMLHTGRERLVVVDGEGLAVGCLSVTNVLQWLVEATDSGESREARGELVSGPSPVMRDLMRRTVSVPRDVPIRQARALIKAYGLETLPVVWNGGVVGVVAEGTLDLFLRGHEDDEVESIPVEAVMTTPPPVCAPDESVLSLAERLGAGVSTNVFVIEGGQLLGVVRARDLPGGSRRGR